MRIFQNLSKQFKPMPKFHREYLLFGKYIMWVYWSHPEIYLLPTINISQRDTYYWYGNHIQILWLRFFIRIYKYDNVKFDPENIGSQL